jgi:hypothetical protein
MGGGASIADPDKRPIAEWRRRSATCNTTVRGHGARPQASVLAQAAEHRPPRRRLPSVSRHLQALISGTPSPYFSDPGWEQRLRGRFDEDVVHLGGRNRGGTHKSGLVACIPAATCQQHLPAALLGRSRPPAQARSAQARSAQARSAQARSARAAAPLAACCSRTQSCAEGRLLRLTRAPSTRQSL